MLEREIDSRKKGKREKEEGDRKEKEGDTERQAWARLKMRPWLFC